MGPGETLKELWTARNARERVALLACATFVALAALYAFLWDPGLAARKALSASLPQLRAQVEDMRLQQRDIVELRKSAPSSRPAGDLRAVLRASAERSPIQRAIDTIEWRSSDKVAVSAAAVPFAEWLDWVQALQADLGIRMDACRITALERAGIVRVQATFSRGAS